MLQAIDRLLAQAHPEVPIQNFYEIFHLIILFYSHKSGLSEIKALEAFADAISTL
jgi:hypothetical protein